MSHDAVALTFSGPHVGLALVVLVLVFLRARRNRRSADEALCRVRRHPESVRSYRLREFGEGPPDLLITFKGRRAPAVVATGETPLRLADDLQARGVASGSDR